jgi:glutamate/tyrosine decarboxylase-like PLP-dependent enzyme
MHAGKYHDKLRVAIQQLEHWLGAYPFQSLSASDAADSKLLSKGIDISDLATSTSNVSGVEMPSQVVADEIGTASPEVSDAEVDEVLAQVVADEIGTASPEVSDAEVDEVLAQVVARLKGNYPFHSTAYAGQMLKPPHPVAWSAYALAMILNPNNHALDGGPPSSEMEKEIIPQLAAMFGLKEPVLGHLTSSGTIANLEALWVARSVHPGKGIAFSANAHYTHERMCGVLGIKSHRIPADTSGRWDLGELQRISEDIGTIVVTMGTTGAGITERLDEILPVARELGLRVHLDAAYGGYFKLLEGAGLIDDAPWAVTSQADSIVIDPHKHGLQPYGCGCVLFRDPGVGRFYKHDSPYTYFSSDELHLGEISLECSRAGAAAVALWATLRVFGLEPGGRMAQMIGFCRRAALDFARELEVSGRFRVVMAPELDIVLYVPVLAEGEADVDGGLLTASGVSGVCERVFRRGMERGAEGVFVSLYSMPASVLKDVLPQLELDQQNVTVLRSVLMKPEHLPAVPDLVARLQACL